MHAGLRHTVYRTYGPGGDKSTLRTHGASLTELVQHLGNGYDGILVVVTDLTVDLEPGLAFGPTIPA